MIKLSFKGIIRFPELDFTDEMKEIARKAVIPDLAGRIQMGVNIEGKKYQELAESTIYRKGHNKPLIGEDRKLFSSFRYKKKATNKVVVYIHKDRNEIAEYLQNDGIKSKVHGKRYFKFFGVSEDAEDAAYEVMRNKIRKLKIK